MALYVHIVLFLFYSLCSRHSSQLASCLTNWALLFQNWVRRVCSKATRGPLSFLFVLCGLVSSYSVFIGSSWLNLGFKSWHLGVEFLKAIAFLFTELRSSNTQSSPQGSVTFFFFFFNQLVCMYIFLYCLLAKNPVNGFCTQFLH